MNLQDTLPKTNIDPDMGPMEGCFPLPTRGFLVPWDRLPGCYLLKLHPDRDPGLESSGRGRTRILWRALGSQILIGFEGPRAGLLGALGQHLRKAPTELLTPSSPTGMSARLEGGRREGGREGGRGRGTACARKL